MVLSDISIRRPVFATVMSVLLILVGVIAYQRLTVREYPNIDEPVVTVETTYPGASAEIMETQVTQPLEDSLAGIEGINFINSISRAESSQITITFRLDRDADAAASDVRDRVGRARGRLPDEVDEPIIAKVEADAQPIIYMAFSSDRHSPLQLTDVADRYVKDRLQSINGVSEVQIYGERRYAMRIWIDPERLAAYNLTVQDVEDALRAQNVEIPAGRIESREREFTVTSETNLTSRSGFERIIIKTVDGYPVRLRDVARADISAQDDRVIFRVDGKEAVALGVIKQGTANPLDISNAIREALPDIQAGLPEGMLVEMAYDTSVFIDRSIDNVLETIGEATVLVLLIIFVFLRSLRATLVPLVTIPVSLIASFALMMAFGFSINTLTLLALVLAVGLVVDDAIVMLENISRHVEEGMHPFKAALVGSREIGFAIVAMTLTLAAVYVPVAFQEGRTGQLFTEFALTLAGAVLVSGFVALSLSPMMSSLLLKEHARHGAVYRASEALLTAITRGYRAAVRGSLRAWPVVLLVWLGVGGSSYLLYNTLTSELSPLEDRGYVFGYVVGPEGSTIEYMDKYVRRIEGIYGQVPEHSSYGVIIGFPVVNISYSFLVLKDWAERDRSTMDIAAELFPPFFFGLPGVLAFPNNPPSLGQSPIDKAVNFVIQGSLSYAEIDRIAQEIMAEASRNPGLIGLESDLKLNKPEIKIDVDRDKLADLGIEVATVGRTLETLLGGRQVTRFDYSGEQYDVIVRLTKDLRSAPDDIANIYVRSSGGAMVPLSNIVTIKESVAPRELNHFNKLRAATISASLAPGYSLGDALQFLEDTTRRIAPGVLYDYAGESREFRESSAGLYLTFILALFFIYLVLAAQFESFVDPFIIMLTVPLSMTGALLALKLTGGTLNVYSQIGLVTLIGLITKHGILIVEFANQIRERGVAVRDAVVEAATLRLRPILMTTGAMVLGAVPLATASGAGAEVRQQIGWVIVGGISIGTLFTLFVVPTVYMLLARPRRRLPEEAAAPAAQPAE
jgi:multidrug efflux pump